MPMSKVFSKTREIIVAIWSERGREGGRERGSEGGERERERGCEDERVAVRGRKRVRGWMEGGGADQGPCCSRDGRVDGDLAGDLGHVVRDHERRPAVEGIPSAKPPTASECMWVWQGRVVEEHAVRGEERK
eukprot:2119173-Rhodomonas_salina.2